MQVVTVAKFQGGGAFNVIPDSVTIGGTFRAFSKESFFQLKERIEEVNLLNAICLDSRYLFQSVCPFEIVTVLVLLLPTLNADSLKNASDRL